MKLALVYYLFMHLKLFSMYFTCDDLAAYLHLSKSTIYKGTMSNRIPHIKAGKKLLFEKEAIDRWLQKYAQPTIDEIEADINSLLKSKNHEN
jgi:excisionase family DNA binding protein